MKPSVDINREGPSFDASFAGMIKCTKALLATEFHELSTIAEQCRERLEPLGEPLEQDIGLNRWLAAAREEAYSDWLQWLFNQMSIAELADVLLPELRSLSPDTLRGVVRAQREIWVERGHEDRAGRIDLLLSLGDWAIVVLEIKLGPAESADTKKQVGYFVSYDNDPKFSTRKKHFVLLVTDAAKNDGGLSP